MSARALVCVDAHLRRHATTITDVAVMYAIAGHAHDDGGGAFPAQSTLAAEVKTSRRSVQRALVRLETSGVLDVERNAGRAGTNRYRLKLCSSCATGAQEASIVPFVRHRDARPSAPQGRTNLVLTRGQQSEQMRLAAAWSDVTQQRHAGGS